jgi:hypothetical protein
MDAKDLVAGRTLKDSCVLQAIPPALLGHLALLDWRRVLAEK